MSKVGYFIFSAIRNLDMNCLYLLFILQLYISFCISIGDTSFSESLRLETSWLDLTQL